MEQKNQINEVLGLTMQKLKDMVDVNTVVGTPITTPDGVTVIPVSKISVGFASGGSDFAPKSLPANKANCFGGGTGAGISVVPVSFLIIHGDNVRIINADPVSNGPIDKAIDLLPELVDKVSGMIEQRKCRRSGLGTAGWRTAHEGLCRGGCPRDLGYFRHCHRRLQRSGDL